MKYGLMIWLGWVNLVLAQQIVWQDISNQYPQLPSSVRLMAGIDSTLPVKAWYLDIDMNDSLVAIRPYLSTLTARKEGVPDFCRRVGAYAAINGGFFDTGTGTSYSAVVYPGEVPAENISALTRNSQTYPVTRAFIGFDGQLQPAAHWIYHFGRMPTDIYTFNDPLPNHEGGSPVPIPDLSQGSPYPDLQFGLGGGPMLIKNNRIRVSYDEEVFWGSGVGLDNRDPRSAIGYTSDHHMILLAVDGRQSSSTGLSLPELALVMQQLGCCEAINLDGGGSTQIAVDNRLINRPEGGSYTRPVPTIWAVVHRDSLPKASTTPDYLEEKIIDTGTQHPDTGYAEAVGSGWIETANNGYWGSTKSRLNAKGTGENQFRFKPVLTTTGMYEVFGWWVAASNRCTDTHILVIHDQLTDTVKVDQTTRHAQWASLGTFHFTAGDTSAGVVITNFAPQSGLSNIYVVADAIRWAALSSTPVHEIRDQSDQNSGYRLIRSYPNPFQDHLTIEYQITRPGLYKMEIFNLLGQRVARPVASRYHPAGSYQVVWDGMINHSDHCASGTCFVMLSDGVSSRICRVVSLR